MMHSLHFSRPSRSLVATQRGSWAARQAPVHNLKLNIEKNGLSAGGAAALGKILAGAMRLDQVVYLGEESLAFKEAAHAERYSRIDMTDERNLTIRVTPTKARKIGGLRNNRALIGSGCLVEDWTDDTQND